MLVLDIPFISAVGYFFLSSKVQAGTHPSVSSDAERPARMEKLFLFKGDSVLLMKDTISLKYTLFLRWENHHHPAQTPVPPSRIQDVQGPLKEHTSHCFNNSLINSAHAKLLLKHLLFSSLSEGNSELSSTSTDREAEMLCKQVY